MVVNIVYAMFDTFGVIHATTEGGPSQATNILVYKVYRDGFVNLNLGSSAAQSVILMGIVIVLTVHPVPLYRAAREITKGRAMVENNRWGQSVCPSGPDSGRHDCHLSGLCGDRRVDPPARYVRAWGHATSARAECDRELSARS